MNNVKNTFDVYLLPQVMDILKEREMLNVVRIYTDEVVYGEKRSRFGYEGDTWYIPEAGKYYDHTETVIIFEDNQARKRSGNIGIDIIAPCAFEDAQGDKVKASKLPKWAARTWVEIHGVSYPKRIQEITEAEIASFGFERGMETGDMITWQFGGKSFKTNMGLRHVFKTWWNENMGGWRLINRGGQPHEYLAYPYGSEEELRDIAFRDFPKKVFCNPYIIIYTIKVI